MTHSITADRQAAYGDVTEAFVQMSRCWVSMFEATSTALDAFAGKAASSTTARVGSSRDEPVEIASARSEVVTKAGTTTNSRTEAALRPEGPGGFELAERRTRAEARLLKAIGPSRTDRSPSWYRAPMTWPWDMFAMQPAGMTGMVPLNAMGAAAWPSVGWPVQSMFAMPWQPAAGMPATWPAMWNPAPWLEAAKSVWPMPTVGLPLPFAAPADPFAALLPAAMPTVSSFAMMPTTLTASPAYRSSGGHASARVVAQIGTGLAMVASGLFLLAGEMATVATGPAQLQLPFA